MVRILEHTHTIARIQENQSFIEAELDSSKIFYNVLNCHFLQNWLFGIGTLTAI